MITAIMPPWLITLAWSVAQGAVVAVGVDVPELLTKHPDVALQVLRSQGATCGQGAEAKILTRCPPERLCLLAGGELCVYGHDELAKMTQLTRAEICESGPRKSVIAGRDVESSAVLTLLVLAVAVAFLRSHRARARRRQKAE
jgi:hypothetical protein